jgi:chromodomain-helicase-DNA-binding protein 1
LVAAGRLPPSQAEVRFSSRRTKQVTNYNEEEEDQFEEEIDDDAIPNYYSTTVEDAGPGIDKVVDYRLKEGLGMFSQSAVVIMSLTASRT